MRSSLVRLAAVAAFGALLSGCAGLNEVFDELDRAAELQAERDAQQPPVQQTDYVAACLQVGGCGVAASGGSAAVSSSTSTFDPAPKIAVGGCPYIAANGDGSHRGGTACPQ
jgi:hypothetical protein